MTIAGRARKIAMLPLWLLQLFGTSKSFAANPVLGNRTLNRMGLHAARYLFAHLITNFRWFLLSPLVERDLRRQFLRDGVICIPDFLPAEQFAGLKRELATLNGETLELEQGDTLTLMMILDRQALAAMPVAKAVYESRRFQHLMRFAGARIKYPFAAIHCVKNGYASGTGDPQKTVHSDTFHPTMKSWLFVDPVSDQNGPFMFVPGSQRLTWKRLKWEYRQSIAGKELADRYSTRGSLRAGPQDLAAMGLPQAKPFKVPANTLVIANTHGFHRRGAAAQGSSRMALIAQSRTNPFNPVPGFGFRFWRNAEDRIFKRYWRWAERKAARRGQHASWHPVPTGAFYRCINSHNPAAAAGRPHNANAAK